MFFLVRADNWLVDTGSEPSQHNGLSLFGKVSVQAGIGKLRLQSVISDTLVSLKFMLVLVLFQCVLLNFIMGVTKHSFQDV